MDIQLSRCAHFPFVGKQAGNDLPHLFPTFKVKSSLRNAIFLILFSAFPEQRLSNVSPASSCIPPVLRSVHMSYHHKNIKSACVSEPPGVFVLPGAAFPTSNFSITTSSTLSGFCIARPFSAYSQISECSMYLSH